jgi:hypothetical protein
VNIDQHGSPSSTFQYICQGREGIRQRFSVSTAQLALERGMVSRPVADLCHGGRVRVAYSQYNLPVNNGTNRMVGDSAEEPLSASILYSAAWNYEILATFFHSQMLTPTFIDNNDTYPQYDEETGEWTGSVGLVSIKDIFDHLSEYCVHTEFIL